MESIEVVAGDGSTTLFGDIAIESRAAPADDVSVVCHENQVPPFVESELDRLYGHIFSSLPQLRVYGELGARTSTYVARQGGKIIALLLFRRDGNVVRVLNQSIRIGSAELRRFTDYIFSTCRAVSAISFHAVQPDTSELRHPHQRYNCADDIVIALPGSAEAYQASLGKNMRRNLRRYMDRLTRAFPSFRVDFHEGEKADAQQIRAIIGFNRARMAGKNKVSTLDELETERIVQLTQECGLLSVASIDGRICAGGIAYRVGDNFFLYVIAHDPAYDDYWVGILTCYLTICGCIARGGKAFHFLWGRYDYKFALGAVLHTLDHVDIYRSRARYLLNGPAIARTAVGREVYRLKFALLDMARRKDSLAARVVSRAVARLRRMKRFADGVLSSREQEPPRGA